MTFKSDHAKGLLITLLGVLILTPDTLLFRLINTDVWTITFWRGILMPAATFLFFIAYYRRQFIPFIFNIGRIGILIAFINAISNLAFNVSVTYTTVAKTLIILAASPVFAAVLSIFILKERPDKATWIVIAFTFTGICIVVSDHLGQASGSLLGDSAAFVTAIFMALSFTLMRKSKDVNMVPAFALGWFISALIVWPFASPLSLSGTQIPLMALMGLFILPVSFGLINLGPRYIPAPEVSLLMLLETVFGPLWVWLVIHEQPNVTTLVGGSIVVLSISVYSIWRLKTYSKISMAT